MNAIELKPCPFCGADAEMDTQRGFIAYNGKHLSAIAAYCTRCPADISGCKEDFPDITPEWIAGLWNSRSETLLARESPARQKTAVRQLRGGKPASLAV